MGNLTTALAKKNHYRKERYVELVRTRVKRKYPCYADEIALLRKEVFFLRKEIEILRERKLPDTEFTAYNETVENIQAVARAETN